MSMEDRIREETTWTVAMAACILSVFIASQGEWLPAAVTFGLGAILAALSVRMTLQRWASE